MSGTVRTGVIRTKERKDGVNVRSTPNGEIVGGMVEETPVDILSTQTVDGHIWYFVKQKNGTLQGWVFENVHETTPRPPSPSPKPQPAPKVQKLRVVGGSTYNNKNGTWFKIYPAEKHTDLSSDLKEFIPASSEYQVEVLGEEKLHYKIRLVGTVLRGKTEWFVYKFHVEVK
ncbi:MAG TPA: SH3 domain-containing protein [Oscillatoriales cyanobacterium M59_W2019_021]|nr:MAG: SH3 domain-containing protein [Cyanobacteria bacterium J055]HIK32818.1 SH3 domain-containing protein [Oscillatoriales cyanobacterium M4454_W2019_049]HIK51823.1 SH3 domain-containing protein [Oscillatoriales cyanobacterium M59_W2019_021]